MRHWLFFSIAFVLAGAAFLRSWAGASEYEKRKRMAAEIAVLAEDYTSARREAFSILQRNTHDIAGIDAYLSARPERLVRKTGLDITIRGVAALLLYGQGQDAEARALAEKVSRMLPPQTAASVRAMPIVRRVIAARVLAESGRQDEARLAAQSVQDWIDARTPDRVAREQSISVLMDLGWAWRVLGEEPRAQANWKQMLDYHEGRITDPYNMACFTALVGQNERAMAYLRKAVTDYRTDTPQDNFGLDRLMDGDPDLDTLRAMPEFIELRNELERKAQARRLFIMTQQLERDAEGIDPSPPQSPSDDPDPVP